MQTWKGWPLERLIYLFLAVAYLVVWAQIYLFHGVMAEFEHKAQVIPVIVTPIIALSALWYALSRVQLARITFLAMFWLAVVTGLMGMFYHIEGVGEMEGGYTLQNFAFGPPVLLPLTYTALAIMGLAVAMWPVKLTAPDFEQDYTEVQATRRYRGRTPA